MLVPASRRYVDPRWTINTPYGNLVGLVEPLAKVNGVLQKDVHRVAVKDMKNHNLSSYIQNELIQILPHEVQEEILKETC